MKHDFLDKYGNLDSAVHRIDPRAKLITAISGIAIVVSEPQHASPAGFIFYLSLILLVIVTSGIPLVYYLKRLLIVSPFVLMASVFYPLSVYLSDAGYFNLNSSSVYNAAFIILLKSLSALLILIILTSTDKFHRLLLALRRLRFPRLIITISALIYRYIFIISDEMMRTTRARDSRTPGHLISGRFSVYGNQVAVIFLRSWERSHMVYRSMLSRGFTGDFPVTQQLKLSRADIILPLLFILLMLAVRLFNYLN